METFTDLGYVGLFLISFLAATILPLSSEVVLCFLLLNGFNPILSVSIATVGNVLGSYTNYALGFWGGLLLIKKVLKMSEEEVIKAQHRFNKYGVGCLFFAWVPVIGDPLTVVAGMLKINLFLFFSLVTSGKLIRYIIITYAVLA